MRIICTGCGIPLEPIAGKVKRSCPTCGVWTDYRHLLAGMAGGERNRITPPGAAGSPISPGSTAANPDSEIRPPSRSGDAVLDQLMALEKDHPQGDSATTPAALPVYASAEKDNDSYLLVQPKKSGENYSSSEDPDDGLPYSITDKGDIFCPQCDQRLPPGAVLCVQCGLNFQTGERVKRAHKVVQLHWVESMASSTRKLIAIIWSCAILALFVTLNQFDTMSIGGVIGWSLFAIPQVCVLLGSYGELALTRNRKGQVKISRKFRIAFVSLGEKIHLPEGHEGLKCAIRASIGLFEWVVLVFLLLPTLLPGIAFYFLVMHRPFVVVSLTKHTGREETVLFRTRDENQGREIAQILHKIIGKTLDFSG